MPTDQPSITTWSRLEPVSRATDVANGVEAALLDPLWLLARQWQLCEFAGDDRGSPALTTLDVLTQPLERVVAAGAPPSAGVPLAPGTPLEPIVQREDAGESWLRAAAEGGAQFARALRANGLGDLVEAFAARYPLRKADAALDPAAPGLRAVFAARLPDGVALAAALAAALGPDRSGPLPAQPAVPAAREPALRTACAAFLDWHTASQPPPAGTPPFWRADELRYAFSVTAGGASAPVRLDARDLDGDRVDWWSFDLAAAPPRAAAATSLDVRPTRVAFRGMPASRHWEAEDAGVDLGSIDAAPDDLLRLLLLEFALGFGRDWSLAPLPVPAGSVTRVSGAHVLDTFGRTFRVRHHAEVDGPDRTWRMFEHDRPAGLAIDGSLLLVPATLTGDLRSDPIEEVLLLRDELAELAWAIERRVPGPTGRTVDRAQAPAAPPRPTTDQGELRYVLEGHVPDGWTPLLPQPGTLRLGRVGSAPTRPRGRLLTNTTEIRDEELPREGVELQRRFRAARGAGGETHLWVARSRRTGRGEAASGLTFDALVAAERLPKDHASLIE